MTKNKRSYWSPTIALADAGGIGGGVGWEVEDINPS
jgi:hypothetical protein